MARIDLASLTTWITAAAHRHAQGLPDHVAAQLGVSRSTAARVLSRLVALGWLERDGSARHRRYRPSTLRQAVRRYPLQGLQEHVAWANDFAPFVALPSPLLRNVEHAFTELVNNAVDHSQGTQVTVSLRQTATQVQLLVSDDGRGLFDKLSADFGLDDARAAVFELGKGKLTSAPERHCGHGLYVVARLADVFQLHANASAFQRRAWDAQGWHAAQSLPRRGTSVYFSLGLDTRRTLDEVLHAASLDGAGYAFERTTLPLRLLAGPGATLESRSLARLAAARLERFERAELDFSGVSAIGHGFADEVFRVFARRCPRVELVALNAPAPVQALIDSVRAA